jgi:hypothetical protein
VRCVSLDIVEEMWRTARGGQLSFMVPIVPAVGHFFKVHAKK